MTDSTTELRASLVELAPTLNQAHAQASGKTREMISMLKALRADLIEQIDRDLAGNEPLKSHKSPVEQQIASYERARRDYVLEGLQQ